MWLCSRDLILPFIATIYRTLGGIVAFLLPHCISAVQFIRMKRAHNINTLFPVSFDIRVKWSGPHRTAYMHTANERSCTNSSQILYRIIGKLEALAKCNSDWWPRKMMPAIADQTSDVGLMLANGTRFSYSIALMCTETANRSNNSINVALIEFN